MKKPRRKVSGSRRAKAEKEERSSKRSGRKSKRTRSERSSKKRTNSKKRKREDPDEEPRTKKSTTGSGWGKVASKVKQTKEENDKSYKEFWLKDGESAPVQFISEEPYCYDAHTLNKGGNYKTEPCQLSAQRHCAMCDEGEKKTWKAAFKVLDYRGTWDKDKTRFNYDEPVEKVWIVGASLADQIKSYIDKKRKDLTDIVIEVTRTGKKMNTSYNIEQAFDEDDEKMFPEDWESDLNELDELLAPLDDDSILDKYY